jgi:hypothetical protein
VPGNPEDDFDTVDDWLTGGNSRVHSSRNQKEPVGGGTKEPLIEGQNIFRGSMPNFFMREISVVRFTSFEKQCALISEFQRGPIFCAIAPGKAPRSCPRSSLSSSPVEIATQLS